MNGKHDDSLRLGRAAQRRAYVLNQLLQGELTNGQDAELLELSVRQVKRLRAAYRLEGPAALVHGNTALSQPMPCGGWPAKFCADAFTNSIEASPAT
jgi:hypothetical protein